ncbi:MAG TPA: GAF domain-containing protein [Anaerolineae bacterium]|nr:GAF domain-containing protein [Anaerolineae bacterium]
MKTIANQPGLKRSLDNLLQIDSYGIPEAQVDEAMNRAQMRILPFVYGSLSVLFVVYALVQALFLQEPGTDLMSAVALVSAVALGVICYALLQGKIGVRWAEPLTAVLALIVFASIQLRLFLTADPKQVANLALFIFAVSVLFISTRWYLLMLLVAFAGLLHAVISFPNYPDWRFFIVVMLAAAASGLVAHVGRVRAFRHTEILRIVERRQRQELRRRNLQLRTSIAVGQRIVSILDLEELLDQIADLVWEQYRVYYVGVFLPEERSRRMTAGAEAGRAVAEGPLQLQAGLTGHVGWVLANGETLVVPDVRKDPRYIPDEKAPHTCCELLLPLKMGDRVLGVLDLQSERPGRYAPDEIPAFQLLADQIAVALENARLYAQVKAFNQELEQKVAERTQSLQEAYAQLERLDKTKTDFITIASHEMLTPLTIVNFNSQMFLEDEEIRANSYYLKWAEGIQRGTARMQAVVDSMLDVAKIDSQSLELYPAPLDLPFLLRQVSKRFQESLQERQIKLVVSPMVGVPEIEADAEAMQKVFYHLLVNAIKYTPDGGEIRVDGRPLPMQLADGRTVDGVEIVVADTGIGIAPEIQDLIFEKFFQTGEVMLHSSGKTAFKGGGSGLGLAIVRGIVEAHHGRIRVESTGHDEDLCPGSRFYINLPLKQPADGSFNNTFTASR